MKCRTAMISDTHLGTRGCQDVRLLDFLKKLECEYLFLVGDIIDGWRLKRSFYWNETHNQIIKEILKLSKKGTKVIWVVGNHDEFMRPHLEHFTAFGNVEIVNEYVHTMDGRDYLVVHGDAFDGIVRYHKWIAHLGDAGYTFLLWLNRHFNRVRAQVGLGYWSLSAYVKNKVKGAVSFITEFEDTLAVEAERRGFDGVVCGHIHSAANKNVQGIHYLNTGDWVESCTAIVETDGKIRIWSKT